MLTIICEFFVREEAPDDTQADRPVVIRTAEAAEKRIFSVIADVTDVSILHLCR